MEWRDIAAKYPHHSLSAYTTWMPVIEFLVGNRLPTPANFPSISISDLDQSIKDSPLPEPSNSTRKAVRVEFHVASDVNKLAITFRDNILTHVVALRSAPLQDTAITTELTESKMDNGLPDAFGKMGPAARINAPQQETRFAKTHPLPLCDGTIQYVGSGTGRASFRSLWRKMLFTLLRSPRHRPFAPER